MSIFYLRTTIIKARSGKSAVASAAYQSGEKLHSDRLGESYHYSGKEEIVYEEILLPPNAPESFKDRERLWNSVEEANSRANSRYARQFVIAVPNEWTREEAIDNCREFIQESFVERGMIADWAYHEKNGQDGESDNHHIHLMCTTRRINSDGSFEPMERKDYAIDENGDRIPIIDPKTGKQKVRIRERNGHRSEEKLWKRITVQSNDWNSKTFLKQIKQEWADICNQHLSEENKIDPRSNLERGLERLPLLHEGSAVREMTKRGIETEISKENIVRKDYNETLAKLQSSIREARAMIDVIVSQLVRRSSYGTRVNSEAIIHGRGFRYNIRIPRTDNRTVKGDRNSSETARFTLSEQNLSDLSSEKISELIKRSESLTENRQKHKHRL